LNKIRKLPIKIAGVPNYSRIYILWRQRYSTK